jgi:hypothetical protein
MTAIYAGQRVTIVAYAAKGDRSQIATARGLRWVRTRDLAPAPEPTIPAGLATSDDAAGAIARSDEEIPQ